MQMNYMEVDRKQKKKSQNKIRSLNKKNYVIFENLKVQLKIIPQRKEVLLYTQYISLTELIIVNEVLDIFVKFYKNKKFEKLDLDLINEEGNYFIKNIITSLIKNFDSNIDSYLEKNSFIESNLLRGLPKFVNEEARKELIN